MSEGVLVLGEMTFVVESVRVFLLEYLVLYDAFDALETFWAYVNFVTTLMVSTVNLLTHASILPISLLFLYFAIHSRRPESIFTAVRNSDDKICFASLLSSSANSASSFAISSSGTVEGSLPSKASFPPIANNGIVFSLRR